MSIHVGFFDDVKLMEVVKEAYSLLGQFGSLF